MRRQVLFFSLLLSCFILSHAANDNNDNNDIPSESFEHWNQLPSDIQNHIISYIKGSSLKALRAVDTPSERDPFGRSFDYNEQTDMLAAGGGWTCDVYHFNTPDGQVKRVDVSPFETCTEVAFSPSGDRLIATRRIKPVYWDEDDDDGTEDKYALSLFDIRAKTLLGRCEDEYYDGDIALSSSGIDVIHKTYRAIQVIQLTSPKGTVVRMIRKEGYPTQVVCMRRGNYIAFAENSKVCIVDVDTGQRLHEFDGTAPCISFNFNRSEQRLVSSHEDGSISIWDVDSEQLEQQFSASDDQQPIGSVKFHPTEDVVVGVQGHVIKLWDWITGETIQTFEGHTAPITTVSFNASGDKVLSHAHTDDNSIRIWNTVTGEQLHQWPSFQPKKHKKRPLNVAMSQLGDYLIVWGKKHAMIKNMKHFKAVENWLKDGCPTTREEITFANRRGEERRIKVDPLEIHLLLEEITAAFEKKQQLRLTKKQTAYWDIFPEKVQEAFAKNIKKGGGCVIM